MLLRQQEELDSSLFRAQSNADTLLATCVAAAGDGGTLVLVPGLLHARPHWVHDAAGGACHWSILVSALF